MTSTAMARARPTDQCGAGWVSGTPGASTSAAIFDQSSSRRSAVGIPALAAWAMRAALSSQPTTSAPPENSALAAIRPEPPRPNTATFFPAKEVIGIMGSGSCCVMTWRAGEVHRNFRVESPASASTTAMIQNRITICGSVQPSCSK